MKKEDILKQQRISVRAMDVLILILKDEAPSPSALDVRELLSEFEEDSGTTVLLFRERVFSDLRRLDLTALLELQQRIEIAVAEISSRDVRGEA